MAKRKNGIMIRGKGMEASYSKRLLTESLISSGFASRMAQQIARTVEAEFEKMDTASITKSQLREIVHKIVRRDHGEDYAWRYPLVEQLDYDVVVEGEGGSFPYSKGIMSQSLMASGLPPGVAYETARAIEIKLKSNQTHSISRENLRGIAYNILKVESTRERADRYLLWRELKRPKQPLIINIGGATGVGKSTIAAEIAHRLGITRIICTDVIRSVMREIIPQGLLPAIHSSSYSVSETLTVPLPEHTNPVLIGFTEQVSKILLGIDAVINRAAEEKISTLIEGVHVIPKPAPERPKKVHEIVIIIAVKDYETHKARFNQRYEENQDRPAEKYLCRFDAIRSIQGYISDIARDHDIPVIDNMNLDQTVDQALEAITEKVQKLGIKPRLGYESLPPNA